MEKTKQTKDCMSITQQERDNVAVATAMSRSDMIGSGTKSSLKSLLRRGQLLRQDITQSTFEQAMSTTRRTARARPFFHHHQQQQEEGTTNDNYDYSLFSMVNILDEALTVTNLPDFLGTNTTTMVTTNNNNSVRQDVFNETRPQ